MKWIQEFLVILFKSASSFLVSCAPPLCACCCESGTLHIGREIEICAQEQDELIQLVRITEGKGYEWDYQ